MYLNFDVKRFEKYSFSYRTSDIFLEHELFSKVMWLKLNTWMVKIIY